MRSAARVVRFRRGAGAPWLGRQCASTSSSLDDAAVQTIALLRQHPGLLKEVQRRRSAEAPSTGSVTPLGRSAYDRAFAEADSDGDGHLSKEEFRRWTLRRGGQYDLSGAMQAQAEAEALGRGSEPNAAPPPSALQLRRLALKIGTPFVRPNPSPSPSPSPSPNPSLSPSPNPSPSPSPNPLPDREPEPEPEPEPAP